MDLAIHTITILFYRNDLAKPLTFFLKLRRKLNPEWYKDPGCRAQPLFDIPLERVMIDELHMFLWVTDILEKGIIYEVINWDEVTEKTIIIKFTCSVKPTV